MSSKAIFSATKQGCVGWSYEDMEREATLPLGHWLQGKRLEQAILDNDWRAGGTNWDPALPFLDTETFICALGDLRGYGRSMDRKGEYNEIEAPSLRREVGSTARRDVSHAAEIELHVAPEKL